MSDQSQGHGWWQASDGKWYAPHLHPDENHRRQYAAPPAPAAPPPQPAPPQAAPQVGQPLQGQPAGWGAQQQPAAAPKSRAELKQDAAAAKARAKAARPWYRKKRIMIPLILVVIIGITAAASGGDDDDKGGTTAAGKPDETQHVLQVGETDRTSDFEVTLVTVESPFNKDRFDSDPAPGSRYIGTEIRIKNVGDERKTMSSLMGLDVRDSEGNRYNIELVGLSRPQLDGTVEPGQLLKGWAVFEVPTSATGLLLHISGSLTASGADFDLGLG